MQSFLTFLTAMITQTTQKGHASSMLKRRISSLGNGSFGGSLLHNAASHEVPRWLQQGLLAVLLAFVASPQLQASAESLVDDWGFTQSYAIIDDGTSSYLAGGINTDNAAGFANAELGDFYTDGTLTLVGGEIKTYKNGGANVCGGNLHYRVYSEGSPAGLFSPIVLAFHSDQGSGVQKWDNVSTNVNLLAGLSEGDYILELYWDAAGSTSGGGCGEIKYDSNSGANYTASFSVLDYDVMNLTSGAGYTGIQAAIDAASAGDVIEIRDGSYNISTPINVDKAVTLQGESESGTILNCQEALGGANSIVVTAGATLKDFTLNAYSYATFGIHVQPGTSNAALSGLTINNTASNGIGLSGVTDVTVSDIAGSGNVQYVLGIAGSVGVTASDISGGNVGVYKGTGTYAQTSTDIEFTGTFALSGGFVIEQLSGADEITYSIDGSAADVKIPAVFDRVFFANYTSLPLPPPYNEASLATLVEADDLTTAIATAQALDGFGYGLEDAAVYNLTADQWEVQSGLTIQDAIDRADAGDVVTMADNTTYAIETTIDVNKALTLQGESESGVIIECPTGGTISGSYGLKVTASSVVLKDFTMDGNGSAVFGIHIQPNTSNTLVQGVTATGAQQNGISLTGTNDDSGRNYITDITVHGNGLTGLGLGASQNVTVSDVTSYNNTFGDISMYIGDYEGQPNDDLVFEEPLNLSGGIGGISYTIESNDPAGFEIVASTVDASDALYNASANVFVPEAYNHRMQGSATYPHSLTSYVLTKESSVELGLLGLQATGLFSELAVRNLESGAWEVSSSLDIQTALDLASSGDVVEVLSGTHSVDGTLTVSKDLTLRSTEGAELDATGNMDAMISVAGGVTFDMSGLTLDGSSYAVAACLRSAASGGTISSNDLSGADAGVLIDGDEGALLATTISNNAIGGMTGAAIQIENSDLTATVVISSNDLSGNGLALDVDVASGISASCNWLGTLDGSVLKTLVSDVLGTTTVLLDGTDDSADVGFQTSAACSGSSCIDASSCAAQLSYTASAASNECGDTTPPVLTIPSDYTVDCDVDITYADASATDNCDADPAISVTSVTVDGACAHSYTIKRTFIATDDAGNSSASQVQTITVQDIAGPELSGTPEATVNVAYGSVPAAATVTATDACSGSAEVTMVETTIAGNCTHNYTVRRVWSATDACDNTTSFTQNINVTDTTHQPSWWGPRRSRLTATPTTLPTSKTSSTRG